MLNSYNSFEPVHNARVNIANILYLNERRHVIGKSLISWCMTTCDDKPAQVILQSNNNSSYKKKKKMRPAKFHLLTSSNQRDCMPLNMCIRISPILLGTGDETKNGKNYVA